jgi:hypothetical protein
MHSEKKNKLLEILASLIGSVLLPRKISIHFLLLSRCPIFPHIQSVPIDDDVKYLKEICES